MSAAGRRRIAVVVSAVGLLTACGNAGPLQTTDVVGEKSGAIAVLVDTPALPAVRCAMGSYLDSKRRGIKYGAGAPEQIATTVKTGLPTDAVILPPGPALDRIREELASPPLPFLPTPTTTFWVAPVTDRGLSFARFLAGRRGSTALNTAPCAEQVPGRR